jgi:shikimate dehydrogenase
VKHQAAVLGSPVAHSLSPAIHNAGYTAAGLTGWSYSAHECRQDELKPFMDSLDTQWAGLSLTMPLKETALSVADEVSQMAAAVGAANTMVLRDGVRFADNTDAPGIVDALAEVGVTEAPHIALLGAGGTARAALGAAAQLGAGEVTVYARRRAAFDELEPVVQRLDVPVSYADWGAASDSAEADLVISTVPKGVADDLSVRWRAGTVLFDVLYDPWPTPLAASAAAAGVRILDGLDLLLAQAVRQFTLFTGVAAPVEAMRAALRRR